MKAPQRQRVHMIKMGNKIMVTYENARTQKIIKDEATESSSAKAFGSLTISTFKSWSRQPTAQDGIPVSVETTEPS